jgi:VWFA-related protein
MKTPMAFILAAAVSLSAAVGQTSQSQQKPIEVAPEDIIRITTSLVQTDVVVTDKNDQIVPDLKLDDFELYDNGKKQDLKFMEFVSTESPRRSEGDRSAISSYAEPEGSATGGISAKDLKRVIAFVVDDLNVAVQDLPYVRKTLLDYVNNKMSEGDLVAIVRVVGGKGLLQQFTADRQLLRRAVSLITPVIHPFGSSEEPDQARMTNPVAAQALDSPTAAESALEPPEIFSSNDDTVRYNRSLALITTANLVIDSLKQIPGRKNLVLITGGIPIFEITGPYSNTSAILGQLADKAFRAGVVVNTYDPRGLRATPGVKSFQATPARSALGGNDPSDILFGRGDPGANSALGVGLDAGEEHLGLSTVSKYTGGLAVYNTNDFDEGLNKILLRSSGYYTLAYRPTESLDNKFHKLEVKVRRGGTRVYNHTRYLARPDTRTTPRTKEEAIAAAARSPLAKNEIDVTPNVAVKLNPGKNADVDIHILIDAKKLNLHPVGDRYQDTLDIVGLLFDQMGRSRKGFSETINLDLSQADYQKALAEGLIYSASTDLPPDYYQVRIVVREDGTGSLGSFSKYLEIPDLTKGKLAMSSVFFFATDAKGTKPMPLLAQRQLHRNQDLRYVAMIYNPRLKDGKPELRSQLIITQGNKVLLRGPEEPLENANGSPVVKMGQLGLSKVAPGRYVLTVIITDTLADKKSQMVGRSLDFTVIN